MWCLEFTPTVYRNVITRTGRLLMDLQDCALGSYTHPREERRVISLYQAGWSGDCSDGVMVLYTMNKDLFPSVLPPKPACCWLCFTVLLSQDCSRIQMGTICGSLPDRVTPASIRQSRALCTVHMKSHLILMKKDPWGIDCCLIREGTEAQRL